MFTLKKIGPLSLAKVQTVIMAIFGLFIGLFYAGMGLIISKVPVEVQQQSGLTAAAMALYTPWAILVMPIFYAVFGFIIGLIVAWLYNLTSKWFGGIQIELVK